MAKRKRDGTQIHGDDARRAAFALRVEHGLKLLINALKHARAFERQKLSKRMRLATERRADDELARLQRELAACKTLALETVAGAHLQRTLLRQRAIRDAQEQEVQKLLPDVLTAETPRPQGTEEEKAALHNVTSQLYNHKVVRECMRKVVDDVCRAVEADLQTSGSGVSTAPHQEESREQQNHIADSESEWNGFDSSGDEDAQLNVRARDIEVASEGDSLESDDLAHYDDRLASASDSDDSIPDITGWSSRPSKQSRDQYQAPSLSDEALDEASPPPPPPPYTTTKAVKSPSAHPKRALSAPLTQSTFLPSLMGGYFSGSESATDIDDDDAAAGAGTGRVKGQQQAKKKNRAGQAARRAIWEKKYGASAKHVVQARNGGGPTRTTTGATGVTRKPNGAADGRDARKGAVEEARGTRAHRGAHMQGRQRSDARSGKSHKDHDNATSTTRGRQEHASAVPDRPGLGTNHPSWQAAKKAKESQRTAAFQGKKMTFT